MHSFGRYCTAVIVALASLHVCAQADQKGRSDVQRGAVICSRADRQVAAGVRV
jgi:hypothetical protein